MLGIDIGNNELKIAAVKGGTVTMVCEKLPANLVKEGCVQLPDAMAEFIRNVHKKNRLPGGECAVILPPAQVFCRHIRFPAMDEERLRLNLPYEMKDISPAKATGIFTTIWWTRPPAMRAAISWISKPPPPPL